MFARLRHVLRDYGELIVNLAVKNLKVQYKHALFGFLWSLFMPLTLMLVFWFVFGLWMCGAKGGIGPLFLICALFPWTFVQMTIAAATNSITENRDIIRKVYFPKEIIPFSIVASNLFNFAISLSIMMAVIVGKRIWAGETAMITPLYLLLPLLFVLTALLAAGVSLFTACGQVFFRDVKYFVEIGLLIWFYFSPVFYPISMIKGYSERIFRIYMLNPFAALVALYRWVFKVGEPLADSISPITLLMTATVTIVLIFIAGYLLFIRREREFVDLA